MATLYHDSDADLTVLRGESIAVLGYGNLGRSIALNLRDSGLSVLIGSVGNTSAARAIDEGFQVVSLREVARVSTILWVLLPDETMAEIYAADISPMLKQGAMLVFASGHSLTFGFIDPPPFVDTALIAPLATGSAVRAQYASGHGFRSLVGMEHDASGQCLAKALALAWAIGGLQVGALETTIRDETEVDAFVQQTILPIVHQALYTAADLLVAQGYPPELVFSELYLSGELSHALAAVAESGLAHMLRIGALTGQFGAILRLERFSDPRLRGQMEATLGEIRSGKFAREWAAEHAGDYPRLQTLRQRHAALPLWKSEQHALHIWQTPAPGTPSGIPTVAEITSDD